MVRINRAPDGATNGERGRIDGPEWFGTPEVLIMVSNFKTWFEHMELYFRAGRIAPERRAALVQYHTDAEVRSIMRTMDVQETDDYDGLESALFEAFGVRNGLERFFTEFLRRKQQRGECVLVFAGHLRRLFAKPFPEMSVSADKILETDNFTEAVEVAAKEERLVRELTDVKTDAYQVDEPTAGRVTEAAAAAVTTRKEVGDDLAEVLRQLKELLTGNPPGATKRPPPKQRRRELSHKILLGWDFMRYHGCIRIPTAGYLSLRQGNIPFRKSHTVAPVRAESPQLELMAHHPAHEAMEKMLSSDLRELADVLSTSDEDHGRTGVVRHANYTRDAKPVRTIKQSLGILYRTCEEERRVMPVLCRLPVDEQHQTEGRPPAPEDLRHFGLAGVCTMFFGPGPGKRILGGWGRITRSGVDGIHHPLWVVPGLMETFLRDLVDSDCLLYLDDVIVFGKTADEHTARLREVFRRLRGVGLKVKPEKCRLMKRRVAYLGHIISEKGIATDPSKTSAVWEWMAPTCVSALRQFLGLASYYRKFVKGFANVAAPLHMLLEKGAEWDWSKACQSSFDAVNCAGPRISGLLSAVHHRRGRQRRPPWGGAEPKGSET
ncbi:Retrovirus-related Pol polyprotein from transposon 17.6 [Trichinella sp. T8]|nr:Retrovirus-related Pol polyprotein from transposon 17.6 [Trichinella sp. T8]